MSEDRFETTGWDREQVRRQAPSSHAGSQQRPRRRRRNPLLRALVYLL